MVTENKVLAVIPARSGSKGIARKNLRSLNGSPLISYVINTLKKVKNIDLTVVSTDCDEIKYISELCGAKVIDRPKSLSKDDVTIDPVVLNAVDILQSQNLNFDIILTVQPTSPFLKPETIYKAIDLFENEEINSVISVEEDTHLRWANISSPKPLFAERANRQDLPKEYKETGGIIAVRSNKFIQSRIVEPVKLVELDHIEAIDIDLPEELLFSEAITHRKKIALWPCATVEKGMGHVYRQLIIADHLISHDLYFCAVGKDFTGLEKIEETFYQLHYEDSSDQMIKWLTSENFDAVILDILDTDRKTVEILKLDGIKVITFEDLGEGAKISDMSINALYSHSIADSQLSYFGSDYFVLRPEFYLAKNKKRTTKNNVTIIFGGSDPNNISLTALSEILGLEELNQINLIIGPANTNAKTIEEFVSNNDACKKVNIVHNSMRVSEYFNNSKIVVCSGGQTLYEVISMGLPAIVISQNKRELTHGLLRDNFSGLINLKDFASYEKGSIRKHIIKILTDKKYYNDLCKECEKLNLKDSTKRVVNLINSCLISN